MKRVLITGGSGFIGRRLAAELLQRGDQVTVLSRDVGQARKKLPSGVRIAAWEPTQSGAWVEELGVVDAVVHLAGEFVAKRWTDKVKAEIERSRVGSTRLIVEAMRNLKHKPSVFVTASAVGYYGSHPWERVVDEDSPSGSGFLSDVVKKWEAAAREAESFGVRTVQVRIGVVFGKGGGALDKMVLPFKMFAGGPVGDGKQPIPWVHIDDVTGIFELAVDDQGLRGPINAVSPNTVNGNELSEALGVVLNRPSWMRLPKAAAELLLGEASEIITAGQRVFPKRAAEHGYEFRHARLIPALESILGQE